MRFITWAENGPDGWSWMKSIAAVCASPMRSSATSASIRRASRSSCPSSARFFSDESPGPDAARATRAGVIGPRFGLAAGVPAAIAAAFRRLAGHGGPEIDARTATPRARTTANAPNADRLTPEW